MFKRYIVTILLGLVVFNFLGLKNARGWGLEAKVIPEEFDIQMKVLTGEDILKIYPGTVTFQDIKFLKEELYAFGRVLYSGERNAIISMDIKCKQIPYFEEKNLKIGWIPRAKIYPIFFLIDIGEYHGNEDIYKFEMTCKIKKVWKK